METPEWSTIATTRQGLYRVFGRALLPPDEDLIPTLDAAADYLEGGGMARFSFYPYWTTFRDGLDSAPAPQELATTYVRLFASGVDGALCPPTESWYKTEARFGGTAEMVAAIEADYRALGLAAVGTAEPPDHAATQLEAMSALCGREATSWRARQDHEAAAILEREDRFLSAHLATWFGDFAARVGEHGGWYGTVTRTVEAFIVEEVDLVRALRRQLGAA